MGIGKGTYNFQIKILETCDYKFLMGGGNSHVLKQYKMDDSFFNAEIISEFEEAVVDYQLCEEVHDSVDSTLNHGSPGSFESEEMDNGNNDSESDSDDDINVTMDEVDAAEEHAINEFMTKTCQCRFGLNGAPCSTRFSRKLITSTRMTCCEMTKDELDLVVLAHLESNRHSAEEQKSSRSCVTYYFHGYKVCRNTYLFAHSVGPKRFKNLITHFSENGLVPHTHGNAKRLPANTLPFDVTEDIVQFIKNCGEVHGLPLPGRIPGVYNCDKALLLPTYMTKRYVFRMYCDASSNSPVCRRKFESLWNQLLPHISSMKPATDLCDICQQYITKIIRSANLPESEKSSKLHEAECHLKKAQQERELYNYECTKAKDDLDHNPLTPKCIHVSFDYAQQIHFPNSPQQVGPLYFLTPRKCQIFGICNEAKCEQVNYLIDENDVAGKGANSVLSMVHHYLDSHVLPSQDLFLHADNAVGQNKNNFVMQYMCWRTLTGKSCNVKLSFMIAGHTKFAPDRFFGLLKKSYRRTSVSSLPEVENMVSASSIAGKNIPQVTVDSSGKRQVIWYDWHDFLSQHFNTIPRISNYHSFRFDSKFPGKVYLKQYSTSLEEVFTIINDVNAFDSLEMPEAIVPPGMSFQRQVYLYEKIRQFCSSEEAAELTCPKPLLQHQQHTDATRSLKIKRKCSHCKQPGHTKTVRGVITCPELLN